MRVAIVAGNFVGKPTRVVGPLRDSLPSSAGDFRRDPIERPGQAEAIADGSASWRARGVAYRLQEWSRELIESLDNFLTNVDISSSLRAPADKSFSHRSIMSRQVLTVSMSCAGVIVGSFWLRSWRFIVSAIPRLSDSCQYPHVSCRTGKRLSCCR